MDLQQPAAASLAVLATLSTGYCACSRLQMDGQPTRLPSRELISRGPINRQLASKRSAVPEPEPHDVWYPHQLFGTLPCNDEKLVSDKCPVNYKLHADSSPCVCTKIVPDEICGTDPKSACDAGYKLAIVDGNCRCQYNKGITGSYVPTNVPPLLNRSRNKSGTIGNCRLLSPAFLNTNVLQVMPHGLTAGWDNCVCGEVPRDMGCSSDTTKPPCPEGYQKIRHNTQCGCKGVAIPSCSFDKLNPTCLTDGESLTPKMGSAGAKALWFPIRGVPGPARLSLRISLAYHPPMIFKRSMTRTLARISKNAPPLPNQKLRLSGISSHCRISSPAARTIHDRALTGRGSTVGDASARRLTLTGIAARPDYAYRATLLGTLTGDADASG